MNNEECIEYQNYCVSELNKICELIREKETELSFIWHWGDGNGGYVIGSLLRALPSNEEQTIQANKSLRKEISASKRKTVFERYAYRCVYCQGYEDLTIDHIIPVSKGGTNDLDNLQAACRKCNSSKLTKTDSEFRKGI
jgi:hypothetical protein